MTTAVQKTLNGQSHDYYEIKLPDPNRHGILRTGYAGSIPAQHQYTLRFAVLTASPCAKLLGKPQYSQYQQPLGKNNEAQYSQYHTSKTFEYGPSAHNIKTSKMLRMSPHPNYQASKLLRVARY